MALRARLATGLPLSRRSLKWRLYYAPHFPNGRGVNTGGVNPVDVRCTINKLRNSVYQQLARKVGAKLLESSTLVLRKGEPTPPTRCWRERSERKAVARHFDRSGPPHYPFSPLAGMAHLPGGHLFHYSPNE